MPRLGPEGRQQLRTAARFSAIGIEMGLSPLVGYFGGRWLDQKLGTAPWLMIIGLLLGAAAGFRSVFRLLRESKKVMESDKEESSEDDT